MRHIKAFYNLDRIANEEHKYQVKCKCGTKTVMVNADKTICRGCGHWLYKNKQIEFRERLKEKINNEQ